MTPCYHFEILDDATIANAKTASAYRGPPFERAGPSVPGVASRDAGRFVRDHARRARPDGGRHRLADDRRRTEGLRSVRLGGDVVFADISHHRADFRPARRLLRAQAVRHRVDRRLYWGVDTMRRRAQYAVSRVRARPAGHRRRHARRHGVRLYRRSLPRFGRAVALAGADEFGFRHRQRHRAIAWRFSHAVLRLALGFLRQSARRSALAPFRLALSAASAADAARGAHTPRLARRAFEDR